MKNTSLLKMAQENIVYFKCPGKSSIYRTSNGDSPVRQLLVLKCHRLCIKYGKLVDYRRLSIAMLIFHGFILIKMLDLPWFTMHLPWIYYAFTMHLPWIFLWKCWMFHGFFPCFPSRAVWAPALAGLEEHRRVTDGEVRRGDLDGGPALTAAVRQTVQVEGLKDLEMWPHMAPWRMDGSWWRIREMEYGE